MNRKDPRMLKPFTIIRPSCAAGLTLLVNDVRVASYNRRVIRERMRIDLAQASFVAIPQLVGSAGPILPLTYRQSLRKR